MNVLPAVFDQIARQGVVPLIAIDSGKDALPLADALIAGGGTGLALSADIAAGKWADITARCKAACEVVKAVRA